MSEPLAVTLAGIGDEAAPDLEGQIQTLRQLGWRGLEIRTIEGVALADLDSVAFAAASRRIAEEDVQVVTLASRIGGWARPVRGPFARDLEELRILAERAHSLGCTFIRIMSYPNDGLDDTAWEGKAMTRIAALTALAETLDVTLLHENCSGWASRGASETLAMLREVASDHLALLFDIGNVCVAGQDPVSFLARVLPHVRHVHVKDVIRGGDRGVSFTWPGEGEARLAECIGLLDAAGYAGAVAMEPHLAHIPHLGVTADAGTLRASFLEFGRRFERLARAAQPSRRDS